MKSKVRPLPPVLVFLAVLFSLAVPRPGVAVAAVAASAPGPVSEDRVMLLRHRKSRIYYLRRFFEIGRAHV